MFQNCSVSELPRRADDADGDDVDDDKANDGWQRALFWVQKQRSIGSCTAMLICWKFKTLFQSARCSECSPVQNLNYAMVGERILGDVRLKSSTSFLSIIKDKR